jgi:hypothetical protein
MSCKHYSSTESIDKEKLKINRLIFDVVQISFQSRVNEHSGACEASPANARLAYRDSHFPLTRAANRHPKVAHRSAAFDPIVTDL